MYIAFYKQNFAVIIFVMQERMSIVNWPYFGWLPCCCKNSFPQIYHMETLGFNKSNHRSDPYACFF